jgi:hypothetical protein
MSIPFQYLTWAWQSSNGLWAISKLSNGLKTVNPGVFLALGVQVSGNTRVLLTAHFAIASGNSTLSSPH